MSSALQQTQVHHNKSRHQEIPLVFIRDDAANVERPLQFGEPILDALDECSAHELLVRITESKPLNSSTKTSILIAKDSAHHSAHHNDRQSSSLSLLTSLIESVQRAPIGNLNIAILGHSRLSPVRRLKQYILKRETLTSTAELDGHRLFLDALPRYFDHFGCTAYPKLATVVIVMDCDHRILLTRRHCKMRSFPSCFVVPGGSVDAGETMADAAKRELLEEVGIDIGDDAAELQLVALWESVFPDSKRFDVVTHREIKYHHIVPIYVCTLKGPQSNYPLTLCPVEVDCALWVDADELRSIIDAEKAPYGTVTGVDPKGHSVDIAKECLFDIYPNRIGQGIARGHLYGLQKLLKRSDLTTSCKL